MVKQSMDNTRIKRRGKGFLKKPGGEAQNHMQQDAQWCKGRTPHRSGMVDMMQGPACLCDHADMSPTGLFMRAHHRGSLIRTGVVRSRDGPCRMTIA